MVRHRPNANELPMALNMLGKVAGVQSEGEFYTLFCLIGDLVLEIVRITPAASVLESLE